jgi:hypothetical protein
MSGGGGDKEWNKEWKKMWIEEAGKRKKKEMRDGFTSTPVLKIASLSWP